MNDGIDRRGFLKCMAWAGTGLVWTFAGGIPVSRAFGQPPHADQQSDFTFVQISDSHIGFNKPANTDVAATLQAALDKINAAPTVPDFILHTGDLTHSSKPAEFDTLDQILKAPSAAGLLRPRRARHLGRRRQALPGALRQGHQRQRLVQLRSQRRPLRRAGQCGATRGHGHGCGTEQLDWLEARSRAASSRARPIVVFAHIPLWAVYPDGAGAPPTASRRWRC